ncbi:MAG: hypothetical protein ACRCYY_00880 [Trueperaceae bacterium]
MADWELLDTYNLVEKIYGPEKYVSVKPYLESMKLKSSMAKYHREEFHRIIDPYFPNTPNSTGMDRAKAFFDIFSNAVEGNERVNQYSLAQISAEAHMNAYAQVTHSLADIFATVLSIILLPTPIDKVNLYRIRNKIKATIPQVHQTIDKFLSSDEFQYLNAYTNTIKHISLVDVSASMAGDGSHSGLQIKSFSYQTLKGELQAWPKKYARDFIGTEFQSLMTKIAHIGVELNNHLKSLQN